MIPSPDLNMRRKCHARNLLRSRSMRGALRCALYARALFGMSLSLISERVREELDVLLQKCVGHPVLRFPIKTFGNDNERM